MLVIDNNTSATAMQSAVLSV